MKIPGLPETENRLALVRRARGLSAAQLAESVAVSRQTIHAIEAGKYIPNAVVALRLARALETTVEEIFRLPDEAHDTEGHSEKAVLLSGDGDLRTAQPVQLGRVGKKLVASAVSPVPCYLPSADALLTGTAAPMTSARVRLIRAGDRFENRLVVAGCDPGISVLARYGQMAGIELVLVHCNSSQSLALLKQGCVHIAGSHLRDAASGESNLPHIARLFPKKPVAVISFAWWEEGILTAPGNPKSIKTVEDMGRRNVSMVNREPGAGARLLLDQQLAAFKMEASHIRGYATYARGHLDAAWRVAGGTADCCIATRAAAQLFGLGFIPLARERYDLALQSGDLASPFVETLFDIMNRAAFRRELAEFGYDTAASGQRVL